MSKTLAILVAASVALASACASRLASESGPEQDPLTGEDAFTAHASRHAIVLTHGFDPSRPDRWSFYKVEDVLRADGHVVHTASVSPYAGVAARAAELGAHVATALRECRARAGCDASQVHIIAHSIGGLDARYLISKLGYGAAVASLTTISTPHRGSYLADVALDTTSADRGEAISAVGSVWGRALTEDDVARDGDVQSALSSMSERTVRESFNPDVQDDPRVTYLSLAGVSEVVGVPGHGDLEACEGKLPLRVGIRDGMEPSLAPAASFVGHGVEMRPNDGVVTVESAKWGKFMGCVPADHMDEVGQPKHGRQPLTGFDHVELYRKLASSLDDEVAAHAALAASP